MQLVSPACSLEALACVRPMAFLWGLSLFLTAETVNSVQTRKVMTAMAAAGDVLIERLRATPLFDINVTTPSKL
jgi:hypothetical protein